MPHAAAVRLHEDSIPHSAHSITSNAVNFIDACLVPYTILNYARESAYFDTAIYAADNVTDLVYRSETEVRRG